MNRVHSSLAGMLQHTESLGVDRNVYTRPRDRAKVAVVVILLCLGSPGANQEQGPVNLNLEDGKLGEVPTGWFLPQPSRNAGYRAILTEEQPKEGRHCVVLSRDGGRAAAGFGNLMQAFDATPFRGKRIRFRAAVRTDAGKPATRAQLWLRVDRKGGKPGFFDNMGDRPITQATWQEYEIAGNVATDAESIALGLMLIGNGEAWLDAASVDSAGKIGAGNEPPRPLEKRGLMNLVAFARLLGYVRYFHPSDQAAVTDWNTFAIDGVRAVEKAKNSVELNDILERLFLPIAPSVRVFPTGKSVPALDSSLPKPPAKILAWRHIGVGLGGSPIYSSTRIAVKGPDATVERQPPGQSLPDPSQPFTADLGGGCSCMVPTAVYADEKGTLPVPRSEDSNANDRLPAPRSSGFTPSGNDRATRLADVILAWNVFQHFYPYFDVVQADWPVELQRTLTQAAGDTDEARFLQTLRRSSPRCATGMAASTQLP